jgi:hypothetical protein
VNAHAATITVRDTFSDVRCVLQVMMKGEVVLPPSFVQVPAPRSRAAPRADIVGTRRWAWRARRPRDSSCLLPAPALLCTLPRTPRSIPGVLRLLPEWDGAGSVLREQLVRAGAVWCGQCKRRAQWTWRRRGSRTKRRSPLASRTCESLIFSSRAPSRVATPCAIVKLQTVGVENLNAENVLVTVLAGRPRDYDPLLGGFTGPRHYRYYFLHPQRHDCFDGTEGPERGFTCWRPE